MLINAQNLADLKKAYNTAFNKGIGLAAPTYKEVAMETQSAGASTQYPMLGAIPQMRKWVGPRHVKNLDAYKFTIENESYEATIAVAREAIEDDQYGSYTGLLEEIGRVSAAKPDQLFYNLLNAGFAGTLGLAYDGQYFFDSDHKDGDGPVQSNTGTAALTNTALDAARAAMRKLKDAEGNPLDVVPTHLIVPPALEAKAIELVVTPTLAAGGANPQAGQYKLVVSPYIDSDTKWFLADCRRSIRGIVIQVRKAPVFVARDRDTDDNVFSKKEYEYGTDARWGAGYGAWQLMWGSTGAG